jgi:phage tail-like protein
MPAGVLAEMEDRSAQRDVLLDPFGAPAEVLPWLASLVGLTLDERWPEAARREMLAEAICLLRRRGTIPALRRMLAIYLGCDVIVIERFRTRGLGGGLLGDDGSAASSSVLGFGFRVGGGVGRSTEDPIEGTAEDAFATHAHRFTVIVPCDLDDEREAAVRYLLDLHRPAHTIVDLCTVGAGMRVGIGLHVELSSIVGPSAGFHPARLGADRLGRGVTIGRGGGGVRTTGARVGVDSRVDT